MNYTARQAFLASQIQISGGDQFLTGTNVWNWPSNAIVIKKTCSVTGRLLQGATFNLVHTSAGVSGTLGTTIGRFTTGPSGIIVVTGLVPGSYVVIEETPPPNFTLSVNNTQTAFLAPDGHSVVELSFANDPYGSLLITKRCEVTARPLQHAEFRVTRSDGSVVGTANGLFTTNAQGYVSISNLPPDTYVVTEIRSPAGFHLDGVPQTIRVNATGNVYQVNFTNLPYSTLTIRKFDASNMTPLAGARFEVRRTNGEWIGSFVTNANGLITIPNLMGWFSVTEVSPPPGFMLGDNPTQIVEVGAGLGAGSGSGSGGNVSNAVAPAVLTFLNYRYSNLTIQKINSITRAPLAGVHFEISSPDGTRLINPQTGFHTFITDRNGLIFLPVIEDGRFYLRETRALPGFIVDEEIIAFTIDAEARRRASQGVGAGMGAGTNHVLVVENTPAAGLVIIKTDAQTGRPLQGVEFEVRHADGRLVMGQALHGNQPSTPANSPQLGANGRFITDHNGRINLNHLVPGVYHVRETRTLDGFVLDTTVHVVTVTAGEQSVLEVANVPLGGVRLLKMCAFTGRPLHNVEFMVFDRFGNVVGVFYTDNNGLIDFSGILVEGRYTIRETRPAQGFFRDDVPRTIEIVAGQITEILWENVPYAGQIQILKVSADDNEINGLPAGTPLAGAIFEIREHRTGNLVDRIITDHRGMAVSRPLPLGRYFVEEVQAPQFYVLSTRVMDITIEFATQIVRLEFANQSANLGVSVTKTGPQTVMAGQNHVVYEIRRLRNDSTVALSDFFFREIFPTDVFRVERIVTGTFNTSLRYRVEATTNTGRTIIVNDSLMTTRNNVLDMRPAALGLAANEFVTEVVFLFGQVPAGFSMVQAPRIEGRILNHIFPNGFQFANRVDVGGRHNGEWIVQQSRVVATILVPTGGRIPQTGR